MTLRGFLRFGSDLVDVLLVVTVPLGSCLEGLLSFLK